MKKLLLIVSTIFSLGLLIASWRHLIPLGLTEVFGFVSGGYCVWLTVEENVWNWPVGIVNSIFFLSLFLQTRLFADAGLQVVYIILGLLGWYWWLRGGENQTPLPVRRIRASEVAMLGVLVVVSTVGMTYFLTSVHDAAPFWDALTTVLSLTAQYLLTKKVWENWPVWIVADVIYIWLYSSKHLYLTSVLYALFLILCLQGVRAWRRSLQQNPLQKNGTTYVG